jgi:hypothetical protein
MPVIVLTSPNSWQETSAYLPNQQRISVVQQKTVCQGDSAYHLFHQDSSLPSTEMPEDLKLHQVMVSAVNIHPGQVLATFTDAEILFTLNPTKILPCQRRSADPFCHQKYWQNAGALDLMRLKPQSKTQLKPELVIYSYLVTYLVREKCVRKHCGLVFHS